MATHSSTLAWKSLWTEEPGGLQSMGPQRVGHDFTFIAWTVRMKLLELQACCENSMRRIIHVESVLTLS